MFSFFTNILSYIFCLFGYIRADKLYPEPLSKTEEEYYLKKYFEGDKEAKNKLIEHNLRLVAHIAKKYANREENLEDYISIGTIGLIKAINSFSDKKGFKISTYASKCIDNEILMYIRSSKKNKAEVSINSIIGTDKDGNDMEIMDTIRSEDEDLVDQIYNKVLTKQVVDYVNDRLTEREKSIMNMRYGLETNNPMTQEQVAKKLNLSRSYISRIETKIQKELNQFMCKQD